MTYAIFRLRRRRKQLAAELSDAPEIKEDRAHNQIRLASSEADILERAGVDVTRPRDLLAQARTRLDRRDVEEAISLARSAHEALILAKRGSSSVPPSSEGRATFGHRLAAPTPRPGPGPDSPPAPLLAFPTLGSTGVEEPVSELPPAGSGVRLPKNRVESHFQLTLLVEEIEKSRTANPLEPTVAEAEGLRGQAQQAYGAGDYTDALRLALKGRRKLGTRIEALPPSAGPTAPIPPEEATARTGPKAAEAQVNCPRCGRPNRPSDRFCRACGAPRQLSKCPRCGTPAAESDQFCGGCGSPLS